MVVVATPQIEMRPVAALKPYPGNARQHSKKQVRQIADSITRFGSTNPVLISDDGEMSREQFTGFLQQTLANAAGAARMSGDLPLGWPQQRTLIGFTHAAAANV